MTIVTGIRRYPVKSMLGEDLESAVVTRGGLSGDRRYAVLDEAGTIGSAKHPRKWARLMDCRGRSDAGGAVDVELPDGTVIAAGDPELDARLSQLLDRRVHLSASPPDHGTLERAVPEYDGGVSDAARAKAFVDGTGEALTVGQVASGTFLDFGTVHLVSSGSLRRLRAAYPAGDFDPRRFRPNLVVDAGGLDGFVEDAWLGRRLRVGDALLRVVVPTPRCVVPTLAHDELPADPGLMRAVAREHRVPVLDLGRLSCVGVYLEVLEPGLVHLGDAVVVEG